MARRQNIFYTNYCIDILKLKLNLMPNGLKWEDIETSRHKLSRLLQVYTFFITSIFQGLGNRYHDAKFESLAFVYTLPLNI